VGSAVDPDRIGERVLVRTMQDPIMVNGTSIPVTLGSEIDGSFAQYVAVRSSEAFSIDSPLSDAELATFPCAYSTAEGLLQRAGVTNEDVLITGGSGGVGSALVQLAVMRGARVTAVASRGHHETLTRIGAHTLVSRGTDVIDALGESSMDVVIDVVGGPTFPSLLRVLVPQGRYATSGAVAGANVDLDLRDLYLKDLTLFGCTFHPRSVFEDLIGYIESGRVTPLVAAEYQLSDIVAAQERFMRKDFVGKIAISVP
jgi:NADPH:quinone reductase-like Zn-dependent oxidoreductase